MNEEGKQGKFYNVPKRHVDKMKAVLPPWIKQDDKHKYQWFLEGMGGACRCPVRKMTLCDDDAWAQPLWPFIYSEDNYLVLIERDRSPTDTYETSHILIYTHPQKTPFLALPTPQKNLYLFRPVYLVSFLTLSPLILWWAFFYKTHARVFFLGLNLPFLNLCFRIFLLFLLKN